MKLVPVDFLNAIRIAENSTPCAGSLQNGDNEYCILGAIAFAWAKRNKKSTKRVLNGNCDVIDNAVREAVGARGFGKNHSKTLYNLNDQYIGTELGLQPYNYLPEDEKQKRIQKARAWQIRKLQNLYARSLTTLTK